MTSSSASAAATTAIDLSSRVAEILTQPAPSHWQPTGRSRAAYLDLMEPILRTAATWQDEHGAIIDPVDKAEHGQTSPRFVAPGAILLSAGRIPEFRDKILRGMDWCCMRLSSGKGQSPDFWMRELMTAWPLLKDLDPARAAAWQRQIRSIDPESIYWQVSRDGSKIKELHNWTVYAAAGEAMRQVARLGPDPDDGSIVWGSRFFDKYMPPQLAHFSDLGMYRDPNDPFTYDMTTRLQVATALASGFSSPLLATFDDILRRGALAQLLYVSPAGYSPFGGRSNQMHLQEAILAALSELEARRYRHSNPRLAQAFKRMARLHCASISRWITGMSPLRHLKNGFDPSTRHGCENYAKWSVYSLFAASCLGLAWMFADDEIPEAPAPAEIGGYLFEIQPAFHKVFAVCGHTQVEIETAADHLYDATGLGRFHVAGIPLELGLSATLPARPNYHLAPELCPAADLAIGPGWRTQAGDWTDLAALSSGLQCKTSADEQAPGRVAFRVRWMAPAHHAEIVQLYTLTPGRLAISAAATLHQKPADAIRFTIPLLLTDGTTQTRIEQTPGRAVVHHPGGVYTVEFDPACRCELRDGVANRNGVYRPLIIEQPGATLRLTLTLAPVGPGLTPA